jgi:hypothetical protein
VRLEILTLVGLQLVEPGHAGFHLLGSERFCSHGGSLQFVRCANHALKPMTRVLHLAERDLVFCADRNPSIQLKAWLWAPHVEPKPLVHGVDLRFSLPPLARHGGRLLARADEVIE